MKRRKPHSNRFWVLLFLGIAALCLLSPLFTVYGPTEVDLGRVLQAPGAAHWFGTDSLGRDVFARVLYGGMVSLGVAAVTTAAALLIGLVYGGVSGYVGGRVDNVMMRAVDVVYSIPSTIIVLAFQMVFPNQILGLIIIMSLTSWMTTARVIRGRFLELKKTNFVLLAQGLNIPRRVILFHHMARNSLSSLIVIATFTFASAIVTETALSYLGVGIPIDVPSWGNMINNAQSYILAGRWWVVLFPGIFIIVSSLCVNFTGEYLKQQSVL
ncbi:MAG: peptide ABC transporter permease [Clostridiales bacterium]|jgi:peptide/nickel transport system permease protein|nr:MAG: peptide ABC transporter permease [Clostridiales bacterium]